MQTIRRRVVGAKCLHAVTIVNNIIGTKLQRSSGPDLGKLSSMMQKLKEANTAKDKLAVQNQTLKFRIAELQKEKYSLCQLNKKLNMEVQKLRIQDQGVVILKKKDFNVVLKNYYEMSEELEQMSLLHSEASLSVSSGKELADAYLHNALQAEEELRQFKIK